MGQDVDNVMSGKTFQKDKYHLKNILCSAFKIGVKNNFSNTVVLNSSSRDPLLCTFCMSLLYDTGSVQCMERGLITS